MYREDDPRLRSLYEALLAMATGNFKLRIARSGADDATECLVVLANMVAEELEAALVDTVVRSWRETTLVTGHCFLLDGGHRVRSYSRETAQQLGYGKGELLGLPFAELLAEDSVKEWTDALARNAELEPRQVVVRLVFRTKTELLLPCVCLAVRMVATDQTLVCSVAVRAKTKSEVTLHEGNPPTTEKTYDAKLIQALYDYIMAHLDAPLPTIGELARLFGTNEFRLKDGFRHFFKTSIYQFYNEQRLLRAHLIIEQTSLQLKEIAFLCGFEDYPNFSKAFRKRFGYAPSAIVRKPPIT